MSKNAQSLHQQRTQAIKAMSEAEIQKSKWFKQSAFTKTEMVLHPLVTIAIGVLLYRYESRLLTSTK